VGKSDTPVVTGPDFDGCYGTAEAVPSRNAV